MYFEFDAHRYLHVRTKEGDKEFLFGACTTNYNIPEETFNLMKFDPDHMTMIKLEAHMVVTHIFFAGVWACTLETSTEILTALGHHKIDMKDVYGIYFIDKIPDF